MGRRLFFAGVALAAVLSLTTYMGAQTQPGQEVKAAYDRMDSLGTRINNKVYGDVQSPTFVAGNKLVYKRSVKGPAGAGEFVLVDIATTTKSSPFDHAKLATALSSVAGVTYTALTLPFNT